MSKLPLVRVIASVLVVVSAAALSRPPALSWAARLWTRVRRLAALADALLTSVALPGSETVIVYVAPEAKIVLRSTTLVTAAGDVFATAAPDGVTVATAVNAAERVTVSVPFEYVEA